MSDGIRHFHTHIAGVKHWNGDGTSRQRAIRDLQPLVPLRLEEEPDNLHDQHAVRVCLQDGRQVGYLPRDLARQVSSRRQEGCWYRAVVRDARHVTASQHGGQVSEGGEYLRVDILVAEAEEYVTDSELYDYLDTVTAHDVPAREPVAPVPDAVTEPCSPTAVQRPESAAAASAGPKKSLWQWCQSLWTGGPKR